MCTKKLCLKSDIHDVRDQVADALAHILACVSTELCQALPVPLVLLLCVLKLLFGSPGRVIVICHSSSDAVFTPEFFQKWYGSMPLI